MTDPISHATTTVNEYCLGNRIVSANRDRSVIVDYDKQTITEIDRRAGTYSISSFDDIARATAALRPVAKATEHAGGGWKQTELGPRASVAGRTAAAWQFTNAAGTRIEVAVDRQIVLSKEALDALIGASYPNRRTDEHEALTRAASGGGSRAQTESTQPHVASFALPLDETITWEVEESRLTLRNAVTAVTTEVAPPEVLTIPPGAKRVESSRVALPRLLEELDKLPNAPSRP
ncbi:MAG: hypothetical protein ACXV5L_00425 [Thermoanaerobaculia bacterium]